MMRTFIALELKDKKTIDNIITFGARLKQNQSRIKLVEPNNLHLTVKFLGNIQESVAPKIYKIIKSEINDIFFQGKTMEYTLAGAGQFNRFSVIWIGLKGDLQFLQEIKDIVEQKLNTELNIEKDRRTKFKPHLTIARLKSNRINYKTFDSFKKIISENKDFQYGPFSISQIKLKKSELTPKGPIYTDLEYDGD
ncbi:MAG: RNA 2',3'-cyclic phosphodiesterase [Promethearchaeota archaeon]